MESTLINAKHIDFSQKEADAVRVGIDLAKAALYNFNDNVYRKYSTFANVSDMDYKKRNDLFFTMACDEAFEKSGISKKISTKEAFRYQTFSRAFFGIVEAVIDNVNSKNEIEEILTFADVRNMAEGDSMSVNIKPTNAYFFYKTGRGKSFGNIQKYHSKNVVLTPQPAETTISFNRAEIVAGRVDWGREISRAVRGLRSGYLQDISDIVYDTENNPIGNKIISTGAYSESDFRTQVQKLQTLNGSSNTYIYGTNIALAPILPTSDNLKLGLGVEYMDKGYLATPFGYRAIELPQALKADNTTAIIPNDYVVVMSIDVGKPIMIGISGETRIETMDCSENATEDFVYTVKSDWDVKLAGQGRMLLYRTV